MNQLLLLADVEQAIIDELTALAPTGTSIPEPKPDLFIRVVTTGGSDTNLVLAEPMVTLEAFAKRESAAYNLIATAVARLEYAVRFRGQIGSETATNLRVIGLPQNYPLPSVPSHKRYTATIAPAMRRRVATL